MSAEGGRLGKASQEEATDISPDADDKERLRNAYGGIEIVDDFHVFVEQDGRSWAVPSGGGIRIPPAIDWVNVVFTDGIEYQRYVVSLEANLGPNRVDEETSTERIHRFRATGTSEFNEPWAVEAALKEKARWLIPTELRFEGLAKHAKLGRVVDGGVEEGLDILEDLI